MSRIILTDPHGCYKTLMALIAKLPQGIPLTFAGDLIDRGPDSRKVIEFVKDGGHDCVLGNHEAMMLEELQIRPNGTVYVPYHSGIWQMNGGDACLRSYLIDKDGKKVHDIAALQDHLNWLKTLPYFIEYPEIKNDKGEHLLVTHTTAAHVWGNYDPADPIFTSGVTWERDPNPPKIEGIYNVYGHTPQYDSPTVKEHFACIDTGGYYKRAHYGKLTALQFPELIIFQQENIE